MRLRTLLQCTAKLLTTTNRTQYLIPNIRGRRKLLRTFYSRELLKPIFEKGKCVYECPDLNVLREYCKMEIDGLWDEVKRFENPHQVYVDLSQKLYDIKISLLEKMSKE